MAQSFHPFNTKEELTLLARGEESITPQVTKASKSPKSKCTSRKHTIFHLLVYGVPTLNA
jgi:hypothetical protein